MAETVGSSFWGLSTFKYANYIDFTGFSFCRAKWWNTGIHVFDLLAQRPLLSEMWNRNFPLQKMDFCTFQGFQGRPRFFHVTSPLYKNGPLYF